MVVLIPFRRTLLQPHDKDDRILVWRCVEPLDAHSELTVSTKKITGIPMGKECNGRRTNRKCDEIVHICTEKKFQRQLDCGESANDTVLTRVSSIDVAEGVHVSI